ncbi:MAG TPA: terminase TerL endonuclease subunit [Candidatus Binatia bacterium]|nr:terminase TerL endonuclease subunit [Candidatus Binatia bacterium]
MTPPVCGYTLDDDTCAESGEHFCRPRAAHAVAFFQEILVHTKGKYARKRFTLADWQRDEIIAPVFGTVYWSTEHGEYVRRYLIVWIELARKNGKSEILAGIMLYLLVADREESAEIYGCARDRDQASLAFDVAMRMVQLSPILSKRLQIRAHIKRIIDPKTNSFYQVIAADAAGALGSNPSGVAADEILAWRDRSMWDALRTGMGSGARRQPLMVAATTAGNDPAGFAAAMHTEMQRVSEDPERAPHVFAYMRNTPRDADPFDEANWAHANPALDDFLSREAMRKEALEARNDPAAENGFRQFRLNQWVQQASRWMPMHLYLDSCGDMWLRPEWGREQLAGRVAWAGFDLAAKMDLTAWCLIFPGDDNAPVDVLWRFWLPEAAVPQLDKHNDGKISRWVQAGFITLTDGEVLDYDRVYDDIEADAQQFKIVGGDCDKWSMFPVIQEIAKRTRLREETQLVPRSNTFADMTPGMTALMGLVKEQRFHHHANPVAQWCFDNVEVRRSRENAELIRPEKPARGETGKRIDAVPAAALAVGAWTVRGKSSQSKYTRVTGKVSGY